MGCADGRFTLPTALAMGLRYTGLDLASSAVRAARRRIRAAGPAGRRCSVVRADVEKPADVDEILSAAASGSATAVLPFNVLGGLRYPWRARGRRHLSTR